ncbi:hypothetical protein HIM_03771 [Hirsutella minnesotensis 3608]|uniref:LysM domain-containing protein n=1 Tax=Hirsutella minnesotensis 3608 TaxID=1043627 RepID=A0A0F8A6D6_9HYPO|nr:hypothetical protein HIM_03771 [Hirsutella minnesotensis 3608]
MSLLKPRFRFVFAFGALLLIKRIHAGNDCQPHTWEAKRDLGDEDEAEGPRSAMLALLPPYPPSETVQPGQLNCRFWSAAGEDVNYATCNELAQNYRSTFNQFLILNPNMDRHCQNIKPLTYYCVIGFIEPLRAYDGLCGPRYNYATCIGTKGPCCNSETWTCGNTEYVHASHFPSKTAIGLNPRTASAVSSQ